MTVLSTTYLMLATVGAPSDIPGLLIGANVTTSTSAVLISSEGSVQVNSANAGQAVVVDIFLFVDGDMSPKQVIQRRVYAVNNVIVPNITNWSFSVALTGLAPGISHTFRVSAALVATNGSIAVVGGLSGVTRGSLTAVVVNK